LNLLAKDLKPLSIMRSGLGIKQKNVLALSNAQSKEKTFAWIFRLLEKTREVFCLCGQ
jgi:hypothetical protein